MKYLTTLMLAATSFAHAQVLSQRNITVNGDSEFIERVVQLPDASGAQVVVKQILRAQTDGSLTYMSVLQHEETASYCRAMCEAMGARPQREKVPGAPIRLPVLLVMPKRAGCMPLKVCKTVFG